MKSRACVTGAMRTLYPNAYWVWWEGNCRWLLTNHPLSHAIYSIAVYGERLDARVEGEMAEKEIKALAGIYLER